MRVRVFCCAYVLLLVAPYTVGAAPKVLLHHSFDVATDKPDHVDGSAGVSAGKELKLREPAMRGRAVWFDQSAHDASLRIELGDLAKYSSWTIALWEIIEVKEWLSAPEDNLLTLLDVVDRPIVKLSKSGGMFVYKSDQEIHLDCFDGLYWVRGSREHLALTWDASGNHVSKPKGILRAFWKARPYASLAIDLDRKPVALEIGQPAAGIGVDELFVIDQALSLRGVWDLMRHGGKDVAALEAKLADRESIEAKRPAAARLAEWSKLAKSDGLFEAEGYPSTKTVSLLTSTQRTGRIEAGSNNASTASSNTFVATDDWTFDVEVSKQGDYALAVRYCLGRHMNPRWPQNSTTRTPWTENYAEVEVSVDLKRLNSTTKLYPTGTYNGHRGDVEVWTWQTLAGCEMINLSPGKHTVRVKFKSGLAKPVFDGMLVSDKAGPSPPHPRWVDQYRIPPSWWVEGHSSSIREGTRFDVYKVTLKNRCDEPCSYEVIASSEKMQQQSVTVDRDRIELKPHEATQMVVTFKSPASLANNSEWANIYLWNEDVALRQKYRLWNLIPSKAATSAKRPVLTDAPDAKLQADFRNWLKTRDPQQLTTELKQWSGSRGYNIAAGSPVRGFPKALSGDRLAALDAWMKMSEQEIEQYLPDGPAEFNGYGSGWERTGVEYAGVWHKMPKVTDILSKGDIDLVTSLTVGGPPRKGETDEYTKTYTIDKDLDLLSSVRDTRWKSMMGHGFYGAAPYSDALGRTPQTGVTLLAEAYYLTGDRAYARKAYQMMRIFARKYTHLTKHFNFAINREDRDWWGGRIGGRYLMKFGPRYYHAMGVYVLDLIWDALTPQERTVIKHNVVRWGMYEAMSGPLFERPEYFAAVNKEDMPFLAMGRVLGDPAPVEGLSFFYDVYRDIILPDGIHKCSLGSYGGVSSYATFLKKLSDLGLDVSDDPALRKLFSAQPSFIFSGGGFPNIDDGGGVNLNGLGAGFGCPSEEQYAWGKQLFGDRTFDLWPDLIATARRVNNAHPESKAEVIRREYSKNKQLTEKLWPHVYIAPVKGLAILRNRAAIEPIDWKEVIFDYGMHGGRAHGHAAKLATIPSFNGQIVSMEYGYGMLQPVGSGFHTQSYAHNVVVADGKSQFGSSAAVPVGSLRESHSDPQVQWIDAESTRIYNGIYMRRTVFTTDFGIVDLHLCRSDHAHQYDWMYHSFGVARGAGFQPAKIDKLANAGPLTFARNPRTHKTSDGIQVIWKNAPRTNPVKKESSALLHENAYVRLWSLPAKDTTIALFGIKMTESVGGEIDYAMLRRNATSTVFANIQEPWRESTGSSETTAKRISVFAGKKVARNHEAYALEVTRKDGDRSVYFANYTHSTKTIGKVTTDAGVATWNIAEDGVIKNQKFTKGKSFSTK